MVAHRGAIVPPFRDSLPRRGPQFVTELLEREQLSFRSRLPCPPVEQRGGLVQLKWPTYLVLAH